jgi:hypothetical protein
VSDEVETGFENGPKWEEDKEWKNQNS